MKKMLDFPGKADNMGNTEKAGHQDFCLLPQCIQKPSFAGSSYSGIVW